MFASTAANRSSEHFILSEALGPGMVSTRMGGHITASLCERELDGFRALMANTAEKVWVIDVSALSGFDPRAVQAGARWFDAYKKSGGSKIIYVSKNPAARMAAQALGFSVGVGVRCVTSLAEAREVLGLEKR